MVQNTGLIYGIGHAVYTKSDPRALILRDKCRELASIKGIDKFNFYERFKDIALNELKRRKGKDYCTNLDFYSGLVYEYLNIKRELYTPLFAMGRMAGWIAHIIENALYSNKIIRPATKYIKGE